MQRKNEEKSRGSTERRYQRVLTASAAAEVGRTKEWNPGKDPSAVAVVAKSEVARKREREIQAVVTVVRCCSHGATRKVINSLERNPAQTALPPLQISGEKVGNRLDIDVESVSL